MRQKTNKTKIYYWKKEQQKVKLQLQKKNQEL
jgi:hypothetical protein